MIKWFFCSKYNHLCIHLIEISPGINGNQWIYISTNVCLKSVTQPCRQIKAKIKWMSWNIESRFKLCASIHTHAHSHKMKFKLCKWTNFTNLHFHTPKSFFFFFFAGIPNLCINVIYYILMVENIEHIITDVIYITRSIPNKIMGNKLRIMTVNVV